MKPVLVLVMGFCVTIALFAMDPDVDFKSESESGINADFLSNPAGKDVIFSNYSTSGVLLERDSDYDRTFSFSEEIISNQSGYHAESSMLFSNKSINPVTCFDYSIPKASFVSLTIFDLLGRPVRKLMNEYQTPGVYSGEWDGLDDASHHVPSGAYILSVKADGDSARRQLMLVR